MAAITKVSTSLIVAGNEWWLIYFITRFLQRTATRNEIFTKFSDCDNEALTLYWPRDPGESEVKIEYKFYKGHVLKAKFKKIKEFCLVCYTALFVWKMRPAFIWGYFQNSLVSMSFMGQQRLHWCRFWFRTALMPQQSRNVRLRLEESML